MLKRKKQYGVAALEVAITAMAFAGIALGVQGVVKASGGVQARTHAQTMATSSERRGLEFISDTLRGANGDTVTGFNVSGVATTVYFQKVTGMTSGVKQLGPTSSLAWRSTAAVPGVTQAGEVIYSSGGVTTVVAPKVASGGFTVTNTGTGLKVHLETFAVMSNGEISRASADAFVSLRN